jgi:hypothetical protein
MQLPNLCTTWPSQPPTDKHPSKNRNAHSSNYHKLTNQTQTKCTSTASNLSQNHPKPTQPRGKDNEGFGPRKRQDEREFLAYVFLNSTLIFTVEECTKQSSCPIDSQPSWQTITKSPFRSRRQWNALNACKATEFSLTAQPDNNRDEFVTKPESQECATVTAPKGSSMT